MPYARRPARLRPGDPGITWHGEEIVPFAGRAIPKTERMIGLDLIVQNRPQLRHFRGKGLNLSLIGGSSHSERSFMKGEDALLGGAKFGSRVHRRRPSLRG